MNTSPVGYRTPAIHQSTNLVDISTVKVDRNLSKATRISSLLQQLKDPYNFVCNGVVVKISFTENGPTIEDRMTQYIQMKKNSGNI